MFVFLVCAPVQPLISTRNKVFFPRFIYILAFDRCFFPNPKPLHCSGAASGRFLEGAKGVLNSLEGGLLKLLNQ